MLVTLFICAFFIIFYSLLYADVETTKTDFCHVQDKEMFIDLPQGRSICLHTWIPIAFCLGLFWSQMSLWTRCTMIGLMISEFSSCSDPLRIFY